MISGDGLITYSGNDSNVNKPPQDSFAELIDYNIYPRRRHDPLYAVYV